MSAVEGFTLMMRDLGFVRVVEIPVPFLVTVADHLRAIGGERERELADKLLSYTAPAQGAVSEPRS